MGGRIAPGFPSASPQDYKSLSSTDKERPPGMGRMDYPELGTRPPALSPSRAAGRPRHRASCLPTTSMDRPGTPYGEGGSDTPRSRPGLSHLPPGWIDLLGGTPCNDRVWVSSGRKEQTPPRVGGSSPVPDTVPPPHPFASQQPLPAIMAGRGAGMRRRWVVLTWLILGLVAQPFPAATAQGERQVFVLTGSGPITPAMAEYLDRGLALAEREGAEAVIFQLDTPGGSD